MHYPIEFFKTQEFFARRVTAIVGIPLEDALLCYTCCYRRIGATDFEFNKNHPRWRALMHRIHGGQVPAQAAWELYKETQTLTPDTARRFGCMGYDCRGLAIVMHFRNTSSEGLGPLSRQEMPARLAEQRQLFTDVSLHYPHAQYVQGFSWLYNYESYRRLFPPEFTANMHVIEKTPIQLDSAWGQFINSCGEVSLERVEAFERKVTAAHSMDCMYKAFPFKVYEPQAPIHFFYQFYGVTLR